MRKRHALLLLAGLTLAVPASASAHAGTTTIALDYRLVLDRSSPARGVSVRILDGDRAIRVQVLAGAAVVRGDLGEPMLRITPHGTWSNRGSTTAVAERIVSPGRGWKQVAAGSSFVWHEHRLAPPPYDGSRTGTVARFAIPVSVNGRPVEVGGRFVRYARPSVWPWLITAGLIAAVSAAGLRYRPASRGSAVTLLGSIAGLAGLATLVVFGAADAPGGGVRWVQIVGAIVLAMVLCGVLLCIHGVRRVQFAGIIGACAGVVSLGSVAVFRHGVVVSLLSPTATRALCEIALVTGVTSAVGSFTVEEAR